MYNALGMKNLKEHDININYCNKINLNTALQAQDLHIFIYFFLKTCIYIGIPTKYRSSYYIDVLDLCLFASDPARQNWLLVYTLNHLQQVYSPQGSWTNQSSWLSCQFFLNPGNFHTRKRMIDYLTIFAVLSLIS